MFNSWYKHGVGKNWFKNLEYSLCITLTYIGGGGERWKSTDIRLQEGRPGSHQRNILQLGVGSHVTEVVADEDVWRLPSYEAA